MSAEGGFASSVSLVAGDLRVPTFQVRRGILPVSRYSDHRLEAYVTICARSEIGRYHSYPGYFSSEVGGRLLETNRYGSGSVEVATGRGRALIAIVVMDSEGENRVFF